MPRQPSAQSRNCNLNRAISLRREHDEVEHPRAQRFPSRSRQGGIEDTKGKKIASAVSEPLAEQIADRLNEQAHREEESAGRLES